MELWNSIQAQMIRQGVLDGSFSQCERHICPHILSHSLPIKNDAPKLGLILEKGPQSVKLGHDDTCNLSCPSCRPEKLVAKGDRQKKLNKMLNDFIIPFLTDATSLWLSGDGDPFASRHYRSILRLTSSRKALRINLHTNATLCDVRAWDDCALWGRVETVSVSIDAANAETYSVTRRGGNFERLLRNLLFLSELRSSNEIKWFEIQFVVQAANFREMPAFVEFGRRFGVDQVSFHKIQEWGRGMTNGEFLAAQVWRDGHALKPALKEILKDPLLSDPIVYLGNLYES